MLHHRQALYFLNHQKKREVKREDQRRGVRMERKLCALVFMAWAHLCRACSIDQTPSILVALRHQTQPSTIECRVTNLPTGVFETSIFLQGEPTGKLDYGITYPSDDSITYSIRPTESGNYKCHVTCGGETNTSRGTYIYVRDSGYQDPGGPAFRLQCGLIAVLVLLLLLSASGTYLVLPSHWMKQGKPSKVPSRGPPVSNATPHPTTPEDKSGSVYTSLQPRSDDVYDVLDEDRKSNVKLQAEVHRVPSRGARKKCKPQATSAAVQDKPPAIPDQPPAKRKVALDNSLYENVTR